jgi:hypothetical protein
LNNFNALTKEKEKALAAIDQAQTNSQVNQAATNGVSAIKVASLS